MNMFQNPDIELRCSVVLLDFSSLRTSSLYSWKRQYVGCNFEYGISRRVTTAVQGRYTILATPLCISLHVGKIVACA